MVIDVVVMLIVVGVFLYLINRFPYMDGQMKALLNWVVLAAIIVWLLSVFLGFDLVVLIKRHF